MKKNYYSMGVAKYQTVLNDIYLALDEIEEKYGVDARKQYEMGVFVTLNRACSNKIIGLIESELVANSIENPFRDEPQEKKE